MSNIEKLLKGVEVEWKTLGEIAEIGTGSHDTQDAVEDGNYIFYARGREPLRLNMFDFDEIAIITAGDGVGVGKVFHYAQGKYALHQRAYRIAPRKRINPRFVYHYISANFYAYVQKTSVNSSVSSLRRPMFLKFPIPIPSFEMQTEIARILDKFSTLTAELTAELQARKSQYEYYRNQLLTYPMEESDQPSLRSSRSATSIQSSDNPMQALSTSNPHTGNSVLQPRGKVKWKTLGEVVLPTSNIRWKNTNKSYRYIDLTSVCRDNNNIIETIEINKENAPSRAQKLVLKNDVIFATTRPTQQRLCLIPEEYDGEVASSGYCVLRANMDLVLPKWIYFWITSNKFKNYVEENQSGSAYPAITDAKVKEFKIPIPYPNDIEKSFEEQKHIITILDKFETLTTSMTEGLPKEIELRQKQYEYYRDMLLTFPTDNIKV